MTRKSVQGGYCNWPDNAGCALTKFDCDNPANFISSRQMQDGPVRAHGGSCRWQDAIKETVLGKCSKDGVLTQCATDVEACPDDSGWEGPEPECTVKTTSFGRCDYGMCAWTHEHCHEDNTWLPFDEGCTCDQVQVGGCNRLKDGEQEVFCAVSEDACDDEQSWITPQEVQNAAGFDCFLCRENAPAVTANDVDTNTNTGSSSSSMGMITDEIDFGVKVSIGNNFQTTIIVSTIVGVVIALLIVGLVGWRVFRTKRAFKRAVEGGFGKEEAPPTTAIEVNQNFGNDREYGNTTDMDNASVLSDE
jgi:hypothetical protein